MGCWTGKKGWCLVTGIFASQKTGGFCEKAEPEVVFHLAAQPLVSVGYAQPVKTYETNLMGTVYLLEALRKAESLRSVVVVTTDKVYAETKEAAEEESPLDGFDPYANSKSCAELAAACYGRCFCRGKRHCPVCGQGMSLAAVICSTSHLAGLHPGGSRTKACCSATS